MLRDSRFLCLRLITFSDNAGRHNTVNRGWQARTGHIQKEAIVCSLNSSSRAAQVLLLISYTRPAMPAEVP